MSLREELIEAGAEEMHGDVVGAELVLDAMLNVLSERADEWEEAAIDPELHVPGFEVSVAPHGLDKSIAFLLAVLREDAS